MHIFVTGTDTDIGKTLVSSWLCLHTGYGYFKPIQTGSCEGTDRQQTEMLSGCVTYPEIYLYPEPCSPHLAAHLNNAHIDPEMIHRPDTPDLIIEGAGGVMVPINEHTLMVDLISHFNIPVLVVARSRLGTINHTLLTLEALKTRQLHVLGVIMNGESHLPNEEAITHYSHIPIVARIPYLPRVTRHALQSIPLTPALKRIFHVS